MVRLSTVGVRKKLIRSCEVVMRTLGGRVARYGPLAAASATNASVPGVNTPMLVCHHGLAGIETVVVPGPTSVYRKPVRRMTGESGSFLSTPACRRSRPDRSSVSDPHREPRTGSLSVIARGSALLGMLVSPCWEHGDRVLRSQIASPGT